MIRYQLSTAEHPDIVHACCFITLERIQADMPSLTHVISIHSSGHINSNTWNIVIVLL